MNPLCDFCGAQQALVYCSSDAARLCLPCDNFVHAANALSRRHSRAQLCNCCYAQPAAAHCPDSRLALCHLCDLAASESNPDSAAATRRRIPVDSYTGCPSMAELSSILQGSLTGQVELAISGPDSGLGELPGPKKLEAAWIPSPSCCLNAPNSVSSFPRVGDQVAFLPEDLNVSKLGYISFKDYGIGGDDELCESLEIGDGGFNANSNDDLFGWPQAHPKSPFQNAGLDEFLTMKNLSTADANCKMEIADEAMSKVPPDYAAVFPPCMIAKATSIVHSASSNSDQLLLNLNGKTNINLGFPSGNVCPNMSTSLANLTGESSAANYQDCGLSPMFLTSEPPWDSNASVSFPQSRNEAKLRYNEKKKSRLFGKQIRYASRKARADTRKRVKDIFNSGQPINLLSSDIYFYGLREIFVLLEFLSDGTFFKIFTFSFHFTFFDLFKSFKSIWFR